MTRTLITGGLVVSSTGSVAADVLIDGERVIALAFPGTDVAESFAAGASRVIDASGRLVVPGGLDVHTHMEMPFGGTYSNDTFETGTRAAAWGGTTTIIDFAIQRRGEALRHGLDESLGKAAGNCVIDYGFHMIVSDVNEQSLKEMDILVDEGVTSFKLFMAYPGVFYSTDGEILRAMQQAAVNGATIMMHAENGIAIDVIVAETLARGETDPRFHARSRPSALEGEAAHRSIELAGVAGSPLYIVHLTAAEALASVVKARDAGRNVFAETCPQYLFLSDAELERPGFEGAKFVCSPPLRPAWHLGELGRGDFSKIPNGLPGVENRVDLIYQGVVRGDISVERWVEVIATTPARMFGLYPRKGVIAPGSDADIVVYDPGAHQTISAATHHMNVDYSVYEGMSITGRAETVLSRGTVVIDNGHYAGEKRHGRYLERGTNQYLI